MLKILGSILAPMLSKILQYFDIFGIGIWIFRGITVSAFLALVGVFITEIISITLDIYNIIYSEFTKLGDENIPDTVLCLFKILGMDKFVQSIYGVIFTGIGVYITTIMTIIMYMGAKRSYLEVMKT